jgi:hypothetical protein
MLPLFNKIKQDLQTRRNEAAAMTYEWLVRFLLNLPNKPAIISTHVFSIHFEYLATGGDYHLRESLHFLKFVALILGNMRIYSRIAIL